MGVEPPFIYDRPSSYTFNGPTQRSFNPKAATQASWAPKAPKAKQDGPLVTFNRHPDSYHQSPYGNVNAIPMNPKTKSRITTAWRTQRVLRALALLGALAAVFCVIAIRNTTTVVGWIIRAGPCIALCHTLYAIYFLCGKVNSRSPASCAGYQMFAGLLDTGLLPFFSISCYMAVMDFTQNTYGWKTLFNNEILDHQIIQMFMIVTGLEGLLLILALVVDIYLAIVYRKISNLPPDMNPLEERDNLTARPKHKRNKSELVYEKHLSNSTLASQRFSQMTDSTDPGRRVPYRHSRTDSADRDSFSLQRDFLNEVKDPYSVRASMSVDRNAPVSRPSSAIVPAANSRPAGAGLDHKPARSSGLARNTTITRPSSWLSYADYEGMPAEANDYAYQEQLEAQIRSMSPVSAMSDHENNRGQYAASHVQPYPLATTIEPHAVSRGQENDMPSPEDLSLALPPSFTPPRKRSRDPLGMNPPTPVNQPFIDPELMVRPLSTSAYATPQRQALREADTNSVAYATPASRPASFVGSGTKGRFYGDLRNSLGGSPTRNSHDDLDEDGSLHRSDTFKSADSGNFEVYASDSEEEYDPYRADHGRPEVVRELTPGRQWNGSRQISNSTGNDLHSGYAGLDPEFGQGMARRREVSGKAAEEGRGHEVMVSVSQMQMRPGAAGWARFKGL